MPFTPLGQVGRQLSPLSPRDGWVRQADGSWLFVGRGAVAEGSSITGVKGDYVLLGTAVGGNTFMEVDSIPQTFRDLVVHWHGDHDGDPQFELCTFRFNTTSDTSDYRYAVQFHNLVGAAGNTSASSATFAVVGYVSDSSVSSSGVITIPDYTGAGVILGFTLQGWGSRGAADNNSRTWYGGGRRTRVQVDSVILGVNGGWSNDSVMHVYGVGAI